MLPHFRIIALNFKIQISKLKPDCAGRQIPEFNFLSSKIDWVVVVEICLNFGVWYLEFTL